LRSSGVLPAWIIWSIETGQNPAGSADADDLRHPVRDQPLDPNRPLERALARFAAAIAAKDGIEQGAGSQAAGCAAMVVPNSVAEGVVSAPGR
jgi:hypothetical protein